MCKKRIMCFVLILFVGFLGICKESTKVYADSAQEEMVKTFTYTGNMQSYTIPMKGLYKLEVWGAQGGGADGGGSANNRDGYLDGGKGGYSYGYVILNKDDVLYVCVGGEGGSSYSRNDGSYVGGGYNGGGYCYGGDGCMNAAGGGATSIASVSGTISQIGKSNLSKIYLIAGGGGGASNGDGAWCRANGGGGGGLAGGVGYTNSWTSTEANQSGGYAFGAGTPASGNGGSGGGGGLYGGRTAGKASGGGGSGYIGGVPEMIYKETTYSPGTTANVRNGSGLAKVTMVEMLEYVSLQETEMERIEKQQVDMTAEFMGMQSYSWQKQKKEDKENPIEEDWEDIDLSDEKYTVTEDIENTNGTTTLSFSVSLEDGDYWYRIKMQGEEEKCISQVGTLSVIPLKKDHLMIQDSIQSIEAGATLHIKDLDIWVVYNNEDIMEKISDDSELLDSVYFFMDGQTTEDYTFSHVSDSFETTIRMLDEDEPQDLILYFDVQDHTEPDIQDIIIEPFEYTKEPCPKEITIHVMADDASDGQLEYWYVMESTGAESEHNDTGDFSVLLNDNDNITVYVKDESGNILQWEQNIVFVDVEAPVITRVLTNPSGTWKGGDAVVTVYAEDTVSGMHELAYSFDGGINWQKEEYITLEESTTLKILVRDLVDNRSDVYTLEVKKCKRKATAEEIEETPEEEPIDEMVIIDSNLMESSWAARRNGKSPKLYLPEEQKTEGEESEGDETDKIELIYPTLESDQLYPIHEDTIPLAIYPKKENEIPLLPAAVTVAATVGGGTTGGFLFIFFWFFRKADVYWISRSLEKEYVGTGYIFKKRKNYILKLKTKQSDYTKEGKYYIKTSKRFSDKNRGKYMDIVRDKRVIQTLRIQDKMHFYIGSRKGRKIP